MKRYDSFIHSNEIGETPDGDYVKFEDAQELIQALKEIANQDYRGNCPASVNIAKQVLEKLEIK